MPLMVPNIPNIPRTTRIARITKAFGWWERLRRDDRGEGVISAAIAVLVMAGIGALMWVGLTQLWSETEASTREKVAEIGQ